ncbi:evolutionarily conserved signaling intermediate in Toll pathway, mitochondrial [Oratosquilla oratoria]|uniref:evolutionarily conserved signaling intermediate in Toll pathway, mitochondrial n=1 Tax=Oratosquilla oratoria TaxID=337810 RepID=UPI003F772D80
MFWLGIPMRSTHSAQLVQSLLHSYKLQMNLATCRPSVRHITTKPMRMAKKSPEDEKRVSLLSYFDRAKRNKENFELAVEVFRERDRHMRGHVEFIYAALQNMETFGVHKDVEMYKKLVDLMPKGKMIPQNMFQAEFMHYPKQQQCAIDVLEQMENFGVIPDSEMEMILINTFGKTAHPVRKYARMMYWMPKFKNASPWALPEQVPSDAMELAKLGVQRMCSVDPTTEIVVWDTKEVEDSVDDTWIVSGQSYAQREIIEQLPVEESVKVEGPFRIYLRDQCLGYFILRAEPPSTPPPSSSEDLDDVSKIRVIFNTEPVEEQKKEVTRLQSVHQQDDGYILAICATGSSSRDSLLSWIRLLEKENPKLGDIPVLFTQSSPIGAIMTTEDQTTESTQMKVES